MHSSCVDPCIPFTRNLQCLVLFQSPNLTIQQRRFRIPYSLVVFSHRNRLPYISCKFNRRPNGNPKEQHDNSGGTSRSFGAGRLKAKRNDNIWSIDNKIAMEMEEKERDRRRRGKTKGKRVRKHKSSRIRVSRAMLMEVQTVLQTQEPVIRPAWNTFVSSVSGIWKGIGAVFSPTTAEMEPVATGSKNENLYDCYTLSRIESLPPQSGENTSRIRRQISWVTLNPYGEDHQHNGGSNKEHKDEDASLDMKNLWKGSSSHHVLPKFESFDFSKSDLMEQDIMGMENGLVFFEDGSYSRGPIDIPIGETDNSNYYLSPTYQFEQCLVKGCHKRLRVIHTIEFSNGGSNVQILRVAVYEEEWVSPANVHHQSETELDMKPFSQRKRVFPSELSGPWKVFEVSATPIFGDEMVVEENNGSPYVYFCMETLKKRSLPENPAYFQEEEVLDMQDVTVLWLPGGVTAYVDVNKEGILCIGVGWYSDEGINLVMERDYGTDGKLKEVRSKSEIKRRKGELLDSKPKGRGMAAAAADIGGTSCHHYSLPP